MVKSRTSGLRRATLFSVAGAGIYGISLILLDVVIAHHYGTGSQAAVYQAAYMIPTLLIGVFSGGAILGAFVPVYIRLGGQYHQTDAGIFLGSTVGTLLTVLTPLTALLIWAAPLLVEVTASGFSLAERQEITHTLRLMLLMLVPHAIAYVYYGALVSIGRVSVANLGPLLIPATAIATTPWWGEHNGAALIGIGYFLGTTMFVIMAGRYLRFDGSYLAPILPTRSPVWNVFLRDYLTTGLAYAALAALLLISQASSASLSPRDLTAFSFGTKLTLLALAFFTTIVNSVALPYFSSLVTSAGRLESWLRMRHLLLLTFLLGSFGVFLWVLLSEWIVSIIYARGAFNDADTVQVADVQSVFVLQIPFYIVGVFCWRMLNALGEWKPLLVATIPALLLNMLLTAWQATNFGLLGITAVYTLAIVVWSLILLVYLRARLIN
jgi:putative peptidoglycan lipid II flippase